MTNKTHPDAVPAIDAGPVVIGQTLDERLAGFNAELKQALGKYRLALGAEAFIQNGLTLARPAIWDADQAPTPEPEPDASGADKIA